MMDGWKAGPVVTHSGNGQGKWLVGWWLVGRDGGFDQVGKTVVFQASPSGFMVA